MQDSLDRGWLPRWGLRCVIALALVLVCIAAIVPQVRDSSRNMNYEQRLQPPSAKYPLGTDQSGRDNAVRVANGLRISIVFGSTVALIWGGLCVVVGMLGRIARRASTRRLWNWIVDGLVALLPIAIGIALWLDYIDPDGGVFRVANADASSGFARFAVGAALHQSAVILAGGVGVAAGIVASRWRPRTKGAVIRAGVTVALVLAILAARAEPDLTRSGAAHVLAPSASLGMMVVARGEGALLGGGWRLDLSLAVLWLSLVLVALAFAFFAMAPLIARRNLRAARGPLLLVGLAGFIELVNIVVWQFAPDHVATWMYWSVTGLAVAALLFASTVWTRGPAYRSVALLAASTYALPLALDWPISKALDQVVPHLL